MLLNKMIIIMSPQTRAVMTQCSVRPRFTMRTSVTLRILSKKSLTCLWTVGLLVTLTSSAKVNNKYCNIAIFIVLLKMYISEHANIFRLVIIIPLLTHSPNDKFFLKVICSLQFPSSPVNIQYPVKEYIFVTGMTQTDPPTFFSDFETKIS